MTREKIIIGKISGNVSVFHIAFPLTDCRWREYTSNEGVSAT